MDKMTFQKACENDLDAILNIYNFYIANTTATFDDGQISREDFRQRIFIGHDKYPTFLVFCSDKLAGFCFLTQYKKKKGYDRTAEIGVYFHPEFTGRELGGQAIALLEKIAASQGIKVIVACICSENTASIKLFQKMGYEQCAHYKQVGEKFGRILDVVDFQKLL